jgi:hypothetical protein
MASITSQGAIQTYSLERLKKMGYRNIDFLFCGDVSPNIKKAPI